MNLIWDLTPSWKRLESSTKYIKPVFRYWKIHRVKTVIPGKMASEKHKPCKHHASPPADTVWTEVVRKIRGNSMLLSLTEDKNIAVQ